MTFDRPDLDGARIFAPDDPSVVWLVFDGVRHRIPSAEVYDSLFSEVTQLISHDGARDVTSGPDLDEGSCLVRAKGGLSIYLLTRQNGSLVRHLISSYESFLDFGFTEEKTMEVPTILLETIAAGSNLASARDRASRS